MQRRLTFEKLGFLSPRCKTKTFIPFKTFIIWSKKEKIKYLSLASHFVKHLSEYEPSGSLIEDFQIMMRFIFSHDEIKKTKQKYSLFL